VPLVAYKVLVAETLLTRSSVIGTARDQSFWFDAAALATRVKTFTAQDLIPYDLQALWDVRAEIASHQVKRCKQFRFRKDPAAYLAEVERRLLSS
jgi:hypothetical protein